MKKYFLAIIVLILSVFLTILATGFEFQNLESLMKPPMVEGENRKIQLAFENFVGKDYQLVTPLKGIHRAAYNFFDLNGDKDDEVIVFYSKSEENDVIRMNVLDRNNDGTWVSIADIVTEYSDVQQVDFADLNGDNIEEIIVGWTVFQNEYTKTMNVYMLSKKRDTYIFEMVYNSIYYDFITVDINCDNNADLLKIDYIKNIDRSEYVASYLGFKTVEIHEFSSIVLDLSFSSVTSITSDYLKNENRCRVYLDGPKHESGVITDCIYFDNVSCELKKERSGSIPLSTLSSRITNISSRDINNDGIIEIPTEKEMPLGECVTKDGSKNLLVTEWVQLNSDNTTTVSYSVFNATCCYSYRIPEDMFNEITVKNNLITGEMTFYKINSSYGNVSKGDALFTIIATESSENAEDLDFRYKYLCKKNKYYYFARIFNQGEKTGITKSLIINNISFN